VHVPHVDAAPAQDREEGFRVSGHNKLKVAIVSANWGAIAHLPAWRVIADDVEVVAMCTANRATAEAAAKRYGVTAARAGSWRTR
jgi:predicted dehydrogenase